MIINRMHFNKNYYETTSKSDDSLKVCYIKTKKIRKRIRTASNKSDPGPQI